MTQISLPVEVPLSMVPLESTLGGAIGLCAKLAGLEPKQVQAKLKADKAQWSRWESGAEGIVWPKFMALMDECGNDAPLLWMLSQRGYDLHSLRRRESVTEQRLRESQDEVKALRRVLLGQVAA